jgi:hypothetical protein
VAGPFHTRQQRQLLSAVKVSPRMNRVPSALICRVDLLHREQRTTQPRPDGLGIDIRSKAFLPGAAERSAALDLLFFFLALGNRLVPGMG